MRTNIEGVETLKTRAGELTDVVKKCPSQPRDQQFKDTQRRIDALCMSVDLNIIVASFVLMSYRKLSEAATKSDGVRSRGIIKRFFTSNSDAKRLQGLVDDVNTAIQDFVVSASHSLTLCYQSLTAAKTQTVLVMILFLAAKCYLLFCRASIRMSTLCVRM